jgi:hypothetical protein
MDMLRKTAVSIVSKVESGKSAMRTLLQSMLEVEDTALEIVWKCSGSLTE